LPVTYCKNALKLKLTKKYNLLVLVHFYNTVIVSECLRSEPMPSRTEVKYAVHVFSCSAAEEKAD